MQVQPSDAAGSFDAEPAVQHLAVARQEPLMLTGCSDGSVYLYDLRYSQKAAASAQPHRASMVRLACLSKGLRLQHAWVGCSVMLHA